MNARQQRNAALEAAFTAGYFDDCVVFQPDTTWANPSGAFKAHPLVVPTPAPSAAAVLRQKWLNTWPEAKRLVQSPPDPDLDRRIDWPSTEYLINMKATALLGGGPWKVCGVWRSGKLVGVQAHRRRPYLRPPRSLRRVDASGRPYGFPPNPAQTAQPGRGV